MGHWVEILGGVVIIVGGLVTAYPTLVPQWIGLLVVAIGILTIAYGILRAKQPQAAYYGTPTPKALWANWHWTWKLRLERDDPWPLRRYMSLKSAAEYAYGNLHGTLIADAAEMPIMGDAANPPHYIAAHMTSTLHFPLYGHKPHSRKLEPIREEYVKWHRFSEDMERLEDDTGRGKQTVYEKLQMKRADVKKYIGEQKGRG